MIVVAQLQVLLSDGTILLQVGGQDTVVSPRLDDLSASALLARPVVRAMLAGLTETSVERLEQLSEMLANIALEVRAAERAEPDDTSDDKSS